MQVVGLVLILAGFAAVVAGFVGSVRSYRRTEPMISTIRRLRAGYGLDRRRWAEVRRAVHRGVAARDPLRPAGRAYATALLDTPDHGVASRGQLLLLAGVLLQSTGGLLQQLAENRFPWFTVAAMVCVGAALVLLAI